MDKFQALGAGGVSYAEIAKKAWEVGRTGLATRVSSSLFLEPVPMRLVLTVPFVFPQLLDYEPRASDQVPLLLSMKEDRLALQKAVDSGDTDLGEDPPCSCSPITYSTVRCAVYHVLLHLYNRLPLGTFFRLIEDGGSKLAPASKLLQVYAREQNREMLRDFYYSDDRRVESAVLCLDEASRMQVRALKPNQ